MMLFHITICMLLCNEEENDMQKESRKRQAETVEIDKHDNTKKKKVEFDIVSIEKKSDTTTETATASSSRSFLSSEDSIAVEERIVPKEDGKNYRFYMLNYMPNKEKVLKDILDEWGVKNKVTRQWDIIEMKHKKLVLVNVNENKARESSKYLFMKSEINEHSCLCSIDGMEGTVTWTDQDERAKGEVFQLVQRRRLLMMEMNIGEYGLHRERDLIGKVFCSKYINDCITEWTNDLLTEAFRKQSISALYPDFEGPKTITPEKLHSKLSHLDENNRKEEIKWKGKISPENFLNPLITVLDKDNEINTFFLSQVKEDMASNNKVICNLTNCDESSLKEECLDQIINAWFFSEQNSFDMFKGIGNYVGLKMIGDALGIGKKGLMYNGDSSGMLQKENKPLVLGEYPPWYEEVLCGLEEEGDVPGYIPHIDLLSNPPTDGHPIVEISEEVVTEVFKEFLKRKASYTSARASSFYSRMGGAYGQKVVVGNKERSNIAMFPLVVTLSEATSNDLNPSKIRSISGIVVRGPNHARNPTDRINFLTLERYKRNETTECFIKYLRPSIVYICSSTMYVLRQNSIMK